LDAFRARKVIVLVSIEALGWPRQKAILHEDILNCTLQLNRRKIRAWSPKLRRGPASA